MCKKRKDVFDWLRAKNLSIYCLVDFHCDSKFVDLYIKQWGYDGVFSCHSSDSRGVAVLFRKDLDYVIHEKICDIMGNYVIIDITVCNHRFTLVALYAPNKDNPLFFKEIHSIVEKINNASILMCGDWNLVMNYDLDTKGYLHHNNPKAREYVLNMIDSLELYEIWRIENPTKRRYTWHKNSHKMARLDFFIVSSDLATRTEKLK